MMKRILLFVAFCVMATIAMAQHFVSGIVVEAESQEPMVQTTIRLIDKNDKVAAGAVTDVMGRFRVAIPKTGRYTLQISCVGYKSLSMQVRLGNDKDFPLGTVTM
jgi:hypothetical protein